MTSERIEEFDNVILGSGAAGKLMAWGLGKRGERCAVIERETYLGGACPNVACLPTKKVIASAKVAQIVREAGRFGIEAGAIGGGVKVDMKTVIANKRAMVADLQRIHVEKFAAAKAEIVFGQGRFVGVRTLEVKAAHGGVRRLRGKRVFLTVGSRAQIPAIPGLSEAGAMTHVGALELEEVPGHVVVMGAGYVGLEFAQAWRRFGAEVTVVARAPRLLEREDEDVSEGIRGALEAEGLKLKLGASVVRVEGKSGASVKVHLSTGEVVSATHLLVATGRTMNTDAFDAPAGGVQLRPNGIVEVNDRLETTAENVWALGECAGTPQFTHATEHDAVIVLENLAGGRRSTAGRLIPYVLFTDPELAHVGLTEREAEEKGIRYRLAKMPAAAIFRARTQGAPRGFVKALVAMEAPHPVLGFTAFCLEASEMLAAVQTAMLAGAPYTVLRDAIFAHPTLAEGLGPLLAGLDAWR